MRQVLILLKQYNFEFNFKKCQFLKTTIEYLGYVITPSGITLSFRHTEAVANFPKPTKVIELQRFLGLIITSKNLSKITPLLQNRLIYCYVNR